MSHSIFHFNVVKDFSFFIFVKCKNIKIDKRGGGKESSLKTYNGERNCLITCWIGNLAHLQINEHFIFMVVSFE